MPLQIANMRRNYYKIIIKFIKLISFYSAVENNRQMGKEDWVIAILR